MMNMKNVEINIANFKTIILIQDYVQIVVGILLKNIITIIWVKLYIVIIYI